MASKFIAALPEDFIQAFQTAEQAQQGATDLAEMDQDQLTELRLYFQLIRVLEEVEKVETIWMQGLDELREAMPSQRMAWSIKHAVRCLFLSFVFGPSFEWLDMCSTD